MSLMVGWRAKVEGTDYRLWSGDVDQVFGGETYMAGHFIEIGHAGNEIGTPVRRATAAWALRDDVDKSFLLDDIGPKTVLVTFIFSRDKGLTWREAPGSHRGRLSSPSYRSGIYSIEIETYRGDADRGRPQRWSHERQVKRNGDRAFEMAADLAAGIETKWPP